MADIQRHTSTKLYRYPEITIIYNKAKIPLKLV